MNFWSYFAPLLLSICIAYGLQRMLKMKADIAYPVGYMVFGLSSYALTLFGITITTGYFVFLVSFVLINMILIIRRKISYRPEKRDIEIMIAFTILYTIVFFFDLSRGFTHWDEMSHWGPMVKENLRLNQLYSVEASKLQAHKDYPPVKALFEAAWSHLCGGYSEKYIYRSLHMLIASMIFPMFTYLATNEKRAVNWICRIFAAVPFMAVCTVFSLDDGNLLTTIYADGVLAVTAAFCIFLILILHEYKGSETVVLAVALSFLMLLKQIGFEYFCLCYLLLVLMGVWNYVSGTDKKIIIKRLAVLFIVPVASRASWNLYIKINELDGQFVASKFDINVLKAVIMKTDINVWQYQGTVGYIDALFTKPLAMLGAYIISYVDLVILFAVAYVILCILQKRIRKNCYVFPMFIVYIVSVVGHAMMMWISYMFMYCESDFLGLACYERYMNVIWIFNGVVLVCLCLKIGCELLNSKQFVVFTGGCDNMRDSNSPEWYRLFFETGVAKHIKFEGIL